MQVLDPKLFDIKENFHEFSKLWGQCLDYIKINCKNDPLYENYLEIKLENFECFIIMVDRDEIISFGGVDHRPERWGTDISRVLTRFWIKPTHRTQGLTKWRSDSIKYSPSILTPQIDFLKKQQKIKSAMITREGKYKNSFREIVRLANSVSPYEFKVMSGRYNVCQPLNSIPESCQQMIAVCSLADMPAEDIFSKARSLGYFQEIL